jgi:hypothetical protein
MPKEIAIALGSLAAACIFAFSLAALVSVHWPAAPRWACSSVERHSTTEPPLDFFRLLLTFLTAFCTVSAERPLFWGFVVHFVFLSAGYARAILFASAARPPRFWHRAILLREASFWLRQVKANRRLEPTLKLTA